MSDNDYSSELGVDLDEIDDALRPASEMRVKLDEGALERYAEILKSLDPVRLRWDPSKKIHWVEDGAHRITVARAAGQTQILAKVDTGSYEEAFWTASRANEKHGLQVSPKDKRHRVEIAIRDSKGTGRSQGIIADICNVTSAYVGQAMADLGINCLYLADAATGKITGKDGKAYSPPKPRKPRKPKPKDQPQPTPEPELLPEAAPPPEPDPVAVAVAPAPVQPEARPEPPPEPEPLPEIDWMEQWSKEKAAIMARYHAWPEFARSLFVEKLLWLGRSLHERHPDIVFRTNVPLDRNGF
jgi:hypothetical protein